MPLDKAAAALPTAVTTQAPSNPSPESNGVATLRLIEG